MGRFWCPVNLLCQTLSCSLYSNDDFSIFLRQRPWEYSCMSTHHHDVHEIWLTHSLTTATSAPDTQHRESGGVRHESFHAAARSNLGVVCCLAGMSCCWTHQLLDAQSRSYWHSLFLTHRACPPFEPLNDDLAPLHYSSWWRWLNFRSHVHVRHAHVLCSQQWCTDLIIVCWWCSDDWRTLLFSSSPPHPVVMSSVMTVSIITLATIVTCCPDIHVRVDMLGWFTALVLVMAVSIEQTALSSPPLLLPSFVLVCRHDGKHHNIFNHCHVLPRCRCTHSHARLNCFMHHRYVIDVLRWPSFRSRTLTMHLLTLISRQRLILIEWSSLFLNLLIEYYLCC